MTVVYGPAPEFFETQNDALQKFGSTNANINFGDILLVAGGIVLVGISCYYIKQYYEEKKIHASY
ncbi:MAG: hypothetical protein WCG95_07050 [bacterium]